jgi:RES domain-containing protein
MTPHRPALAPRVADAPGLGLLDTRTLTGDPVVLDTFWQGPADVFHRASLVTDAAGNRWNEPGEPAIYLAGDVGVALVEAGRHGRATDDLAGLVLWRVSVAADAVLDLRSGQLREELGLAREAWIGDRGRCRRLATRLRVDGLEGVLVPSAGIPEDERRWNLVLFVDRLRRPLRAVISSAVRVGDVLTRGA